jgi:hypothetical protein
MVESISLEKNTPVEIGIRSLSSEPFYPVILYLGIIIIIVEEL